MLKKLLKYDLKSGMRIFGFVWLGIAVMTGLICLIFSTSSDGDGMSLIGTLGMVPLMIGIIGSVLFANIYVALRFYKGLLGREGYLMFTLPTQPWKLLTSKLISGVILVAGTTILSLGSIVAIMASMMESFQVDLGWIWEFYGVEISLDWAVIVTVLGQIVSITASILQIYLACCLAHLSTGKRGFLTILYYFVLNSAISFLSSILQRLFSVGYAESLSGAIANSTLYYTIPFNLGLSILFFVLCELILRKKLNLE